LPIEPQGFAQRLTDLINERQPGKIIIPLHIHGNHFGGLYLTRDSDDPVTYSAIYFDPAGQSASEEVKNQLINIGIAEENITSLTTIIQSYDFIDDEIVLDNLHCGAFVGFFLPALVREDLRVSQDGRLELSVGEGWKALQNLRKMQSDELGKPPQSGACSTIAWRGG
jgi:hypothetical protein